MVPGPGSEQVEWAGDCRPNALIRLLAGRFPGFQTVCGSLLRRVQTVYDLAEKRGVSLRFN